LLLWDGTGLMLVSKRLEQGTFRWPTMSDGVMRLTSTQLSALLEGLDWTRVRAVRVHAPQATL
jgi:transposase